MMAAETTGAAGPGRGGRLSRLRECGAVLRPLGGQDLETVLRPLGVTAATLTTWREAFTAAGETALATRTDGEEPEAERLNARPGEALIERDLLREKTAAMEDGRPSARRRPKP